MYIHPLSRYDTTNMSEATTTTNTQPQTIVHDLQRAARIFCQPPAPDNTQLAAATTTAILQQHQPTLSADDVAILQSLITEAGQAEHLQVSEAGISGTGVSHLDKLACARTTRGLLLFCEGRRWNEISAEIGVNWALWDAWTGPKAIKRLAIAAMERKDRVIFQDILAAAQKEAANDQEEYVIGRVGKDKDGILDDPEGKPLKKRRPNTKMRELFLKAHDPRFRDSSSEQDKGAGGRPIVYNITFNGTNPTAAAIPKAAEAIEATFTDAQGGKQAENSPFG